MLISWVHSTFHLENGRALLFVARRNEIVRRHLHIHHGRRFPFWPIFQSALFQASCQRVLRTISLLLEGQGRASWERRKLLSMTTVYSGCPTENHFKTHSECGNLFLSYKKNLNAEVLYYSASYSLKTGFILRIIQSVMMRLDYKNGMMISIPQDNKSSYSLFKCVIIMCVGPSRTFSIIFATYFF